MRKLLGLLLPIALCFAACGKSADVDLTALREEMMDALSGEGITDVLPLESDAIAALYGIETAWVNQSVGLVTMYGAVPDEVILIEAVDHTASEQAAAKLEEHLLQVLEQTRSYDPGGYAAIRACTVEQNGNYVGLILSPSADKLHKLYTDHIH